MKKMKLNIKKQNKIDFKIIFRHSEEEGIDLLKKMMNYIPENRISAKGILNHGYFSKSKNINKFKKSEYLLNKINKNNSKLKIQI